MGTDILARSPTARLPLSRWRETWANNRSKKEKEKYDKRVKTNQRV